MRPIRLLAVARLLRLPNVFTAFADILMATCAAGTVTTNTGILAFLLPCSGLLYLGGMVWNDFFDRHEDAKTRPNRPIPSGQFTPMFAALLAAALFSLALGFANGASVESKLPLQIAAGLAALILLYDGVLKHYWIGPLAMGGCRFLNVLLGLSAGGVEFDTPFPYHLAGVVGVYIVGVTWFARTEEGISQRWHLISATFVMAIGVLLGVTIPAHLDEGRVPIYAPYLFAAFAFTVGWPVVAAIRQPTAANVQRAVKRCILGLVLLDAALAVVFVGWPGLLIGLLLLPAAWLGKWVYST